jgi:NAD-dependent deacetylase
MQHDLRTAREVVARARRITVLTGAGISAESGIRTFRGADGLWKNFRPEDLATPQSFQRDPVLVWEWYQWRRQSIAQAQPNAGHLALARRPHAVIVTQNVDGLHQRAGSRQVLEIHGSIWTLRCVDCGREWQDETPALPPRCPCGGLARPGVVWFGESLPTAIWNEAGKAVDACDCLLVVGTSAVVYPAAALIRPARSRTVIEVNIEQTPATAQVDLALRGPAGQILPELLS